MNINAVSVGLVILPLAFVDVAVGVPELTATVSFVFAPLALILGVVWPYLHARSVPHFVLEIALVNCTVLKGEFLDELETLLDCLLLKIEKILILGVEEVRYLTFVIRILRGRHLMLVLLRESAISVVVALLLPVVVDFVFNLDFAIFFCGVNASTSITHFFEYCLKFI